MAERHFKSEGGSKHTRPMKTSPNPAPTENAAADLAASRFMHLLHHPEKIQVSESEGDESAEAALRRASAVNDLTGASVHVPPSEPVKSSTFSNGESEITIGLGENSDAQPRTRPRQIAPWLAAVSKPQEGVDGLPPPHQTL